MSFWFRQNLIVLMASRDSSQQSVWKNTSEPWNNLVLSNRSCFFSLTFVCFSQRSSYTKTTKMTVESSGVLQWFVVFHVSNIFSMRPHSTITFVRKIQSKNLDDPHKKTYPWADFFKLKFTFHLHIYPFQKYRMENQ